MSAELPALSVSDFSARLAAELPPGATLPSTAAGALYQHYLELRRWNPRLSLVGPGTVDEIVERHYGEALQALPLLDAAGTRLLDLGSGGGFPAVVLAAARPDLDVFLVEPRQRKWAFLTSATHRAGLPVHCLDARVEVPLSSPFQREIALATTQYVTVRALKLTPEQLVALEPLLLPDARLLLWWGSGEPALPEGWHRAREVELPGSARRRILECRRG